MVPGEIIGFIGGALTTGAFIPQVIRVYRRRSARDISMPFVMAMMLGGISWLVYGFLLQLYPVILWNALSIMLVTGLLAAKLKYGK